MFVVHKRSADTLTSSFSPRIPKVDKNVFPQQPDIKSFNTIFKLSLFCMTRILSTVWNGRNDMFGLDYSH